MQHEFTPEQIRTILTHYLLSRGIELIEQWFSQSQESTFKLRLSGPAYNQRSAEIEIRIAISEALPIIERMRNHPLSSLERRGISIQHHKLLRRYFSTDPVGHISVARGVTPEAPMENLENTDDPESRFWLAVNGDSAAVCPHPLPVQRVQCSPRPQLLLGFRTRVQAIELQSFILSASLNEARKRLKALAGDPEVVSIVPNDPEPPTRGSTIWTAG
jgi:hypothetical protein